MNLETKALMSNRESRLAQSWIIITMGLVTLGLVSFFLGMQYAKYLESK